MSYESSEAALKTVLTEIPSIGPNVYLDDLDQLSSGTQRAINLRFGSFTQQRRAMGGDIVALWTIDIQLLVRYVNDKDVRNGLRDLKMAVLDKINAHSRLGNADGIFDAFVISGRRGDESVELGGISFLSEILTIEITDELDVVELD